MTVDTSTWTLTGLVKRQAEALGEREFMAFEQGPSLTFAGYDRETDRLAQKLAGLGVERGDRVLALVKNRIEFMLVLLATMKLGAIFVPINTELKGAFLQHQLRNAEPRVVFVDATLSDAFRGVEGGNESLLATIYVAGPVAEAVPAVLAGAPAMESWRLVSIH